jgi:hypothetical protein
VADFYEQCRPLLEESLHATARMAEGQEIEVLYVTGGGSELPLVSRVLREEFGRKVKRSEYTRSATAIGLAIQADATSGYQLREMFTRNFGVWRESDAGRRMIFDPIFPVAPGCRRGRAPLKVRRVYQAAHGIGHFRYIETRKLARTASPREASRLGRDLFHSINARPWAGLEGVPVVRSGDAEQIEEQYGGSAGVVTVTIRSLTSQYERKFRLSRWGEKATVASPRFKGARRSVVWSMGGGAARTGCERLYVPLPRGRGTGRVCRPAQGRYCLARPGPQAFLIKMGAAQMRVNPRSPPVISLVANDLKRMPAKCSTTYSSPPLQFPRSPAGIVSHSLSGAARDPPPSPTVDRSSAPGSWAPPPFRAAILIAVA